MRLGWFSCPSPNPSAWSHHVCLLQDHFLQEQAGIHQCCLQTFPQTAEILMEKKDHGKRSSRKTRRDSERLHLLSAPLLLSGDPEQSSLSSPAPPTGYLSVKISANPTAIRSTGRFFILTIVALYNQCFYCKVCKSDPGTVPRVSLDCGWT